LHQYICQGPRRCRSFLFGSSPRTRYPWPAAKKRPRPFSQSPPVPTSLFPPPPSVLLLPPASFILEFSFLLSVFLNPFTAAGPCAFLFRHPLFPTFSIIVSRHPPLPPLSCPGGTPPLPFLEHFSRRTPLVCFYLAVLAGVCFNRWCIEFLRRHRYPSSLRSLFFPGQRGSKIEISRLPASFRGSPFLDRDFPEVPSLFSSAPPPDPLASSDPTAWSLKDSSLFLPSLRDRSRSLHFLSTLFLPPFRCRSLGLFSLTFSPDFRAVQRVVNPVNPTGQSRREFDPGPLFTVFLGPSSPTSRTRFFLSPHPPLPLGTLLLKPYFSNDYLFGPISFPFPHTLGEFPPPFFLCFL